MFGKRIDLFKLFGFEVGIDTSWVLPAILIAWSLSVGLFPFRHEGLATQTYWIMGIVGAVGCSAENTVDSKADAMEALALRTRTSSSRLMVTEGTRLAGSVSLKDMMKLFELKVELEP